VILKTATGEQRKSRSKNSMKKAGLTNHVRHYHLHLQLIPHRGGLEE
jgi:hypothetical protein